MTRPFALRVISADAFCRTFWVLLMAQVWWVWALHRFVPPTDFQP